MRQSITIRFDPRTVFDGQFESEVEADVKDGFAIHPHNVNPDRWTVTHVKSGIGCKSYDTLNAARKARKTLSKIAVAGVRFADMEACEALALYPLLVEEWIKLNIFDNPSEETMAKALENRDYISSVVCKASA